LLNSGKSKIRPERRWEAGRPLAGTKENFPKKEVLKNYFLFWEAFHFKFCKGFAPL